MKLSFSLFLVAVIYSLSALGQSDAAYTRHDINGETKFRYSDITEIGNTNSYFVSPTKQNPAYIIDGADFKITASYDVGNYAIGARSSSSPDGKYILLRDLTILEYKLKNRSLNAIIVECNSGKKMLEFNNVSDVQFHPDGQNIIVSSNNTIEEVEIATGRRRKLLTVQDATNCVSISPDGKAIAVSHAPDDQYLDEYLTKKGQKKNFKIYKKYRQCISQYGYETGKLIWTASDMVDIPYVMAYGPGGKEILVYSAPHDKLVYSTTQGSTDYITKVNAIDGKSLSGGFISNSVTEPDFSISHNEQYIAMVTINRNSFPEVWIYRYDTADIVARFECSRRTMGDELITEKTADASRVGVAFTQDDQALLLTYGSIIIKWTIPYE